jgi:hypothetical protein
MMGERVMLKRTLDEEAGLFSQSFANYNVILDCDKLMLDLA